MTIIISIAVSALIIAFGAGYAIGWGKGFEASKAFEDEWGKDTNVIVVPPEKD